MDGKIEIKGTRFIKTIDLCEIQSMTIDELIEFFQEIKKENEMRCSRITIDINDKSDWNECLWPEIVVVGEL